MGVFSRFTDIVSSNINAILDKAEDPQKIVRLMIQEMEDTLVEVRSAAARAIADKKELGRKLQAMEAETSEWQRKAELALDRERDDLAKAALIEKERARKAVEALHNEHQLIDQGLEKLDADILRLEEKLRDAKARQKALVARHETVSHRLQVRQRIHDYRIDDALARFQLVERRMDDLEGRVEAYDLGVRPDLKQELADLESAGAIEKELAELKARRRQRQRQAERE
jgi:phage shock protein A